MALPWFRFYCEFANDPKVQEMPEEHQRRLVMIFCLRCSDVLGTLRERSLAFHLRISEPQLMESKDIFMEAGFVDEDWNVLNWDKRQFISDSSTTRTRAYRERKRTSQERHEDVTKCKGDGLDTDTDKKRVEKKPSRAKKPHGGLYEPVRDLIFRYYRSKNGVDPEWSGREGKALAMLLAANPNAPLDHWQKCLVNRFKSEVAHGDRPGMWIGKLSSFSVPLNQFNKPQGVSNGTIQPQRFESKTDKAYREALEIINRPD